MQRNKWIYRGIRMVGRRRRTYFVLECARCRRLCLHCRINHGMHCCGCMQILYGTWKQMLARCHDETHEYFHCYGGRGIIVCDEWRNDFHAFAKHVDFRPRRGLTLDRIDNNGNYEPGNVRWATWKQQAANKRPSKSRSAIVVAGLRQILSQTPDRLREQIGG
jgi:hypothetical protein